MKNDGTPEIGDIFNVPITYIHAKPEFFIYIGKHLDMGNRNEENRWYYCYISFNGTIVLHELPANPTECSLEYIGRSKIVKFLFGNYLYQDKKYTKSYLSSRCNYYKRSFIRWLLTF